MPGPLSVLKHLPSNRGANPTPSFSRWPAWIVVCCSDWSSDIVRLFFPIGEVAGNFFFPGWSAGEAGPVLRDYFSRLLSDWVAWRNARAPLEAKLLAGLVSSSLCSCNLNRIPGGVFRLGPPLWCGCWAQCFRPLVPHLWTGDSGLTHFGSSINSRTINKCLLDKDK